MPESEDHDHSHSRALIAMNVDQKSFYEHVNAEGGFHFSCICGQEGDFPWVSTGTDRDKNMKALIEFVFSCPLCKNELARSTVDLNQ